MSENLAPVPQVGPHVSRLVPYSPGKPIEEVKRELGLTDVTKLASNENSLGPSPKAMNAVVSAVSTAHLYPDAASFNLIKALSNKLSIMPSQLIFGNGSDEIIHLIGLAFLNPGDQLIQADPSFVRYEASAILSETTCIKIPLKDWTHDLDSMAAAVTERTKVIYITNPNNPTGTIVSRSAVQRFLDSIPAEIIVVFDEAYFEYVTDSEYPDTIEYVRQKKNVIVLRTFSKAYGLAGFRLGYGISRPEIIKALNQVREPFNVNLLAQAAGVAALEDVDHLNNTMTMNKTGIDQLTPVFDEFGFTTTPTQANFLWVDVKRDSNSLFNELLKEGIIVRTGDVFGFPTFLRITVGTKVENERLIAALRKIL